ncbi:hypothetical protein [Lysobacter gummosus]|uniref:hypothetical protein n=1 Tax=Lysobacter gummosus TaxID=262324 RepID=UPI00362B0C25
MGRGDRNRRVALPGPAADLPGDAAPDRLPQLPPSVLCLDQSRRSAPNGFSLSPRGDTVYLSLAKWDGADIGYMDLPEEPKTFVPGWLN